MSQLLERPVTRTGVRRTLSVALAAVGISGAVTLGAGAWFHDQPGNDQPLIVHGVQSR